MLWTSTSCRRKSVWVYCHPAVKQRTSLVIAIVLIALGIVDSDDPSIKLFKELMYEVLKSLGGEFTRSGIS
jgi:hypothetical protein